MSAALMHGELAPAQPLPWTRMWHNSQALVVSVALHSAVVAFLVLGWSMEQSLPEPTPSTLKTRLVMLPAEPVASPPVPEPLPVMAPAPVVEAKPEVVKPKVDPQIQARKLEQAALARKRVEEQKLAQVEQQKPRSSAPSRLRPSVSRPWRNRPGLQRRIMPGERNRPLRRRMCVSTCPSANKPRTTRNGHWIRAFRAIAQWSTR